MFANRALATVFRAGNGPIATIWQAILVSVPSKQVKEE
jgi:hypothetical protein